MAQHFNLAAFEVVVGGAFWAGTNQAFDLDAKFIADAFRCFEHVGAVRVADHLHIAFAVTNIDKNDATVVTAAVDPPAQSYSFAQQGFGHKTAIVGTHSHRVLSEPAQGGGAGCQMN